MLFSFEENTKKMHPKCSFRTPACYVITKIMNNDVYGKRCSEDRMTESTVLHCMGGRERKKKMLSHPLKWHPLAKDKSQGWRRRRRYRSDFLCRRPIPPPPRTKFNFQCSDSSPSEKNSIKFAAKKWRTSPRCHRRSRRRWRPASGGRGSRELEL